VQAVLTLIGIAIVVAVGLWLLGGVFLRPAGIFFAAIGVVSLIGLGDPNALLLVAIGLGAWLAGHWHYAVRNHAYKSPLARRIFLQVLPPRFDPTRDWGIPVIPETSMPAGAEGAYSQDEDVPEETEPNSGSWS